MAVSIFELSVAICVQPWRRSECELAEKDGERSRRGCRFHRGGKVTSLTHAFATANPSGGGFSLADQDRQCERDNCGAQRPFITFNRAARQTHIDLGSLHFCQSFIVNLLHRARSVFQMDIKSASGLGDFAQGFFVQF